MRAIASGEELTIDYAMIDDMAEEAMDCACGTDSCRGMVTGVDWHAEFCSVGTADSSEYLERKIAVRIRPAGPHT
jgi:uncharacterized protein